LGLTIITIARGSIDIIEETLALQPLTSSDRPSIRCFHQESGCLLASR